MGRTLHLRADNAQHLGEAARLLREGALVAFPTETVYGLGANAFLPAAVAGIFRAKERPAWDPLIVHLAHGADVAAVAQVDGSDRERVGTLQKAFWPGPLTLLLPRTARCGYGRARVGRCACTGASGGTGVAA